MNFHNTRDIFYTIDILREFYYGDKVPSFTLDNSNVNTSVQLNSNFDAKKGKVHYVNLSYFKLIVQDCLKYIALQLTKTRHYLQVYV